MERIIHELVQGSPAWHQFRLEYDGASEAPAMLGVSKNVKRSELLHAKYTGIAKEFSDWLQTHVLDHGHHVEAQARPIAEEIIGQELFPATFSYGDLSASCDGITIAGDIAFEHKQWNPALAEIVRGGGVPEEHYPQCQQILLVTGAEKLLFVVSDGTRENFVSTWVMPNQGAFEDIVSGWKQFNQDIADYKPPEATVAPMAQPTISLPALSIQVDGAISLISNLELFGSHLLAFIDGVDKAPETDQGFADAEAAIKTLQKAQDALEAAESGALAQTVSIDEMRRTVALYKDQARTARLMLEKVVKMRKEAIRLEIVQKGRAALQAHLDGLNTRLGKRYMPAILGDFAGVIKGKKTIASLQDAVDTELSRVKIEANAIADRIQVNVNALRELASDYVFLFADAAQIVSRDNDYVSMLIKSRIADHEAAAKRKEEEQRERIRKEEQAKAEQEARQHAEQQAREAKLAQDVADRKAAEEQAERDRVARIAREAEERMAREADEKKSKKREADEAKAKAERDAEEERNRERTRLADEQLDAYGALHMFQKRFGHLKEFAPIVAAIEAFMGAQPKQKAA